MTEKPSIDAVLSKVGPMLRARKQIKGFGKGATADGHECILVLVESMSASERREVESLAAPIPVEFTEVGPIRAQRQ